MSGLMVIVMVVAAVVVLSSVGGLVWFFNRKPSNSGKLSNPDTPALPSTLEPAPSLPPLADEAPQTVDDPLPEEDFGEPVEETPVEAPAPEAPPAPVEQVSAENIDVGPMLARSSDKPLDSKVQAALSAYINSDNAILARTLNDIGDESEAPNEALELGDESEPELEPVSIPIPEPEPEPVFESASKPKSQDFVETVPLPESAPAMAALPDSGPLPMLQSDPLSPVAEEPPSKDEYADSTVQNPDPLGPMDKIEAWPESPSVMSSTTAPSSATPVPVSMREPETRPAVPAVMPKLNRASEPVLETLKVPDPGPGPTTRPVGHAVQDATEYEIEDALDQAFSPGGDWLEGDDNDVQGGLIADIFGQEWSADMFAAPGDDMMAEENAMSVDSGDEPPEDSTLKISKTDLKGLMPDFFDKNKKKP